MCGLVGVAGFTQQGHMKMFRDMLLFDVKRGWDSTGVIAVPSNISDKPIVEKVLGGPSNLWDVGKSDVFSIVGTTKVLFDACIGHNRWATKGAVSTENAHPFKFGDIIGAHNGSLDSWDELENGKEFEVDSKAIYNHINLKGIKDLWSKLDGAAALTWWDAKNRTFNFIRNEKRPLYFATSNSGKCIMWASEAWMIQVSASLHKISLDKRADEKGVELPEIYQIKPHVYHSYSVKGTGVELVKKETLEKKPFQAYKNVTNVVTSTGGMNRNVTYNNVGFKGGVNSLNFGWAMGYEKCNKSWVGTIAKLTGTFKSYQGTSQEVVGAILTTHDNKRIQVLPANEVQMSLWKDRVTNKVSNGKVREMYFKLTERPRQRVFKDGTVIIRVGHSGVALNSTVFSPKKEGVTVENGGEVAEKKYLYDGGYITADQWDEIQAGDKFTMVCVWCGDTLEKEDHEEIKWFDKSTGCCPSCVADGEVQKYISLQ